MRSNNKIINILQHDEILRSAQDDTVLGLIKGERRGDSKSNFVTIFKVCIESPLLSPSMIPKITVILSGAKDLRLSAGTFQTLAPQLLIK